MGLAKIREKNKKKSLVNSQVDYSMFSTKDIDYIKKKVFRNFIEPLNQEILEKKK